MFRFRLQTVLELRQRLEKIKHKEFSQQRHEQQRLIREVSTRKEQIAQAAARLDALRRESISAIPLQLHTDFRRRLNAEIERFQAQQAEQEQVLQEKQKELVEARRARRAIDILRERKLKSYQSEQQRREQQRMDEIASNAYLLNR